MGVVGLEARLCLRTGHEGFLLFLHVMGERAKAGLLVLLFCAALVQGCLASNDEATGGQGDGAVDESDLVRPDPDVYTCFMHNGWERCYITYVPESVNASSNAPLIVELHGWAASAFETRNHTEITTLADEVGAIVVHAEGILVDNSTIPLGGNEEAWNAGYCCADALEFEIDDVDYLRKVIAQTVDALPVDEDRIYLTGWSNGCMMAQRMALQASDIIAAVACTSGYLSFHDAEGYSPVPVMEIHGFIDENQLYTNTVNWGLVDENRRNLESMQTERSRTCTTGRPTTAAKAHCPTATSPEPSTAFRASPIVRTAQKWR